MSGYNHGGELLAAAVRDAYAAGETDYSLKPLVRIDENGAPVGKVKDGDALIFCCRRGEREIELTDAFVAADFPHFERTPPAGLEFVILTMYHEKYAGLPIAFAPSKITGTVAEAVCAAGYRQLHCAESEKFAHVTFFFNGGNSKPFEGEDDIRIPSPKGVPFDSLPALSLPQVADEVIAGLGEGYEFIVTNFANGDVIGHTSNKDAKIECATQVDIHLGKVLETAKAAGYVTIITADHGNLEEMTTPDGGPHVAHTANKVPFIVIDPAADAPYKLRDGSLRDVAPTVLSLLGLDMPESMTGQSLIEDGYDSGVGGVGGDLVSEAVNVSTFPYRRVYRSISKNQRAKAMAKRQKARRVLLIILDGWGFGPNKEDDPIYLAETPVWDRLVAAYPPAQIEASGEAVGLQAGKPGNSEAGHINIGAGRTVKQDDVRLNEAMNDGSFENNEVLLNAIRLVRERHTSLHLLFLLTKKSSHGSIDYPLALLRMARDLPQIYLHVIFDGRSTPPGSAPDLLEEFDGMIRDTGANGQIVDGVGRGIALDRDGNYEKIKKTYNALVFGLGTEYK